MTTPQTYAGQSSAIVAAAEWVEHAMLGTIASAIAVIAVALVGFSLLRGLVSIRRAASVVLGCFILFAAPAIASALKALAVTDVAAADIPEAVAVEPPPPAPAPRVENYDPYAGPTVPSG